MRLGTPGFIGARLREAREARGLSAPALAEILGISRAAIFQYENDQASPGQDILRRLTIILNQPSDFFLTRRDRPDGTIFFRTKAATTVGSRTKATVLCGWLSDIAAELRKTVSFPEVHLPVCDVRDPLRLQLSEIEQLATETRRYLKLGDGPISNVVWLLENNGAIVTRLAIEEPHMDSFSRYSINEIAPLIVLNADKSSAARSRFDAAHELGHWVLHRSVPKEYWSTDAKVKIREQQAHRFASAFLMPRSTFQEDVLIPRLDSFLALKRKWGASVNAMLMRASDIGLVSESHAASLWRNLARRGWRTHEPLDAEMEPESPRLLPKAMELLINQNPQAPFDLVKAISLSAQDVAMLMMLPSEMFTVPQDSNLLYFRRKTS